MDTCDTNAFIRAEMLCSGSALPILYQYMKLNKNLDSCEHIQNLEEKIKNCI